MLYDIMECKVDETNIFLFRRFAKMFAEMINGRKTLVIVLFSKVSRVEQRPMIISALRTVVLLQTRLIEANKELRIDEIYLSGEQLLQQEYALATALVTTALTAVHSGL